MDAKNLGALITDLRRKRGLTQAELAKRLNVSDKAVSRWENGLGFPEITIFPELAAFFGVTVDYLMLGKRRGITFAGNMLVDLVKTVDCYPRVGMLSNIRSCRRSVGGCVPNTAIDLAKIDRDIPVSALGKIGDDENGRFLLSQLGQYGVDCGGVSVASEAPTSFSDVISLPGGERTFFHSRGANALFSPADVDIASLSGWMLHIGYILLLDRFDQPDREYGTVMARFLHEVQLAGIKTSIDVVSDSTDTYREKILPALKYCDYVIVNELESGMLSGLTPYYENGQLHLDNIRQTMEYMAACGVREKIIVHCKKAGFCYDVASGAFTVVPSLDIPREKIMGSVGAGDAFCAGALCGIYHNFSDEAILEFASAAGACNLFSENSIDGMRSKRELYELMEEYPRIRL